MRRVPDGLRDACQITCVSLQNRWGEEGDEEHSTCQLEGRIVAGAPSPRASCTFSNHLYNPPPTHPPTHTHTHTHTHLRPCSRSDRAAQAAWRLRHSRPPASRSRSIMMAPKCLCVWQVCVWQVCVWQVCVWQVWEVCVGEIGFKEVGAVGNLWREVACGKLLM